MTDTPNPAPVATPFVITLPEDTVFQYGPKDDPTSFYKVADLPPAWVGSALGLIQKGLTHDAGSVVASAVIAHFTKDAMTAFRKTMPKLDPKKYKDDAAYTVAVKKQTAQIAAEQKRLVGLITKEQRETESVRIRAEKWATIIAGDFAVESSGPKESPEAKAKRIYAEGVVYAKTRGATPVQIVDDAKFAELVARFLVKHAALCEAEWQRQQAALNIDIDLDLGDEPAEGDAAA